MREAVCSIKQLLKNEYFFSMIIKVVTIFVSLIHSILVARYLGASLNGTNSYVNSVSCLGAIIVTFGIHQAYPFYKANIGKASIFDNYISLVVLLFLFYGLIAIIISFFSKSLEIIAISLLIPIIGYSNVVSYICLIENPKKENFISLIISILDIFLVVGFVLYVIKSFWVAIIILSFSYIVKAIVFSKMIKVKVCPDSRFFSFSLDVLKFGFFPMIALVMTTLNYRLDVIMLKQFNSISMSMLGVYSLGISIAEKMIIVPDTLKGVLISHLSKGADETEVAKIARLSFLSSTILSLVVLIFGKMLIRRIYGEEYAGAYAVIAISALGTIFVGFFKLIAQYNIINKRQHINTLMLSVSIIINVVLNYIFIPSWGINGAAFATGLGHFVCGVVFIVFFSKKTNIPIKKMFIVNKDDFQYLKTILGKKKW